MCQTNAYVVAEGSEEMVMEGLSRFEVKGDTLVMRSIFGDVMEVSGRITGADFGAGKLYIEKV